MFRNGHNKSTRRGGDLADGAPHTVDVTTSATVRLVTFTPPRREKEAQKILFDASLNESQEYHNSGHSDWTHKPKIRVKLRCILLCFSIFFFFLRITNKQNEFGCAVTGQCEGFNVCTYFVHFLFFFFLFLVFGHHSVLIREVFKR